MIVQHLEKDSYKDTPLDQIELIYANSVNIQEPEPISPVAEEDPIEELDLGDEIEAMVLHYLFLWMPKAWITEMFTKEVTKAQCYEFQELNNVSQNDSLLPCLLKGPWYYETCSPCQSIWD